MVLSRRRTGACLALRWSADQQRYQCGPLIAPAAFLPRGAKWLAPMLAAMARRWIAAGAGCDADLQAQADASHHE